VADRRAELETMFKQQMAAFDGPLSDDLIGALIAQQKAVAARVGAPEDVFLEGVHRMLEIRDGKTYLRPSPSGLGGEIYAALEAIDMYAVYREMACPLLLFTAEDPNLAPPGPAWMGELMRAFRLGQRRDLEAIAGDKPNVRLQTVRGSHGLLFERPHEIADATLDFLKSDG
jgi:pimeloyl-ACP methyl ester carboxylesterase